MSEEKKVNEFGIKNNNELEYLQKVEAILFISGKFVTLSELVALSDLNPIMIREIINELKEKYKKRNAAIEIIEKKNDNGNEIWKMDVKPEFSYLTTKIVGIAGGGSEFSKAEQETLAIIAYKQPVKQSVVVNIRGNKAYDHVKRFVELGLVRKKKAGHTNDLILSEEFYNYFNITNQKLNEVKKE